MDAKQAGEWIRQHQADTDEEAAKALLVLVDDAYILGTRRAVQKAADFARALEEIQAILIQPELWEERVRRALTLVTDYITKPEA